ncbi:uncharacterized protein EKO05_0005774 [Ascochyta rabiei]|uniref:Uncharacterized protein n=1 Tax=Didymella rabiei TaxID=5454 RepID=A0A163FB83_DIDRA|nr:uncharacterized protein EKO05_0005774 [Ascochyta rabiei]KZM24242.1 hypothetical protein ST47_g4608 [Ascochyta rabiei]UPX15325.1 hypothetical protein EKO05_0005774 [Ascochyta rabiei]
MAPSNMFSYLRPGHAKRNASSLASPDPVSNPAALPLPSPSQNTEYFASPRMPDNASFTSGSPISPFPPQLPPITRVASKLDKARVAQNSPRPAGQRPVSTAGPSSQSAQDRSMLSPPQRAQEPHSPSLEKKPAFLRSKTDITPTGLRPQGLGISHKLDHTHALDTLSSASTHLTPSLTSPGHASCSKSQTSLMSGLTDKLSGSSKATAAPTTAPAKSKSRLRNPMSLLMRRRSGQTLDPLHDESLVTQRSPSFVPPIHDNYDPSIRGNIVHDFNAPRLNRNFSYNNAYGSSPAPPGAPGDLDRVSPPKIEKEHTPVFREHFDDDTSYEQSQAAVRAEQLANNDFVARNSMILLSEPSPPEPSPAPRNVPPPTAKETPSETSPRSTSPPPPPPYQATDLSPSILSPVEEVPSPTYAPTDNAPKAKKSTKSPPPTRSRATSVTDPSWQPAGLPAHLSSRASRFSFQINDVSDSTQEHVMEERHRKKAAEKASKQAHLSTNTIEDEYDQYGSDNDFDMDDGFEEEIPMLGEEDEFGGLGNQSINDGISTFDFSTLSINPGTTNQMSPVGLNGQVQTPYDVNGNPIGFALSGGMQQMQSNMNDTYLNPEEDDDDEDKTQQLNAPRPQPELQFPAKQAATDPNDLDTTSSNDPSSGGPDLDDDMYFDDGLIGEQDLGDAAAFNEEMFDDPEGPLYERKMKPAAAEDVPSSHPLQALPSETGYEADDDTLPKHLEKSEPSLAHKTSVAHAPTGRTMVSFDDMGSYHIALVDAANRAEAEGRFARKASVDIGNSSSELDDSSSVSHSRPSLVPDDGRFSLDTVGFPPDDDVYGTDMSFQDDYDYSEYDSALENDPMIAAANAEALAFDDEGFYGREFGFYAAAGDAQSEWGGVFGASGLNRAVSGRNAVREPNLTPITERSEYSTRNSFISLNHFRDGTLPIASPGLAQLARMSPYERPGEEEDMSLDTLMRLRKGAFGGSASSLPSSTANSPRNSSPFGMQFALRASSAAGNRMQEQHESEVESDESENVAGSFDEEEEDDDGLMAAVNGAYEEDDDGYNDGDERPESPTLTASDYNSLSSPTGHLQSLPPFSPPRRPQILQMQSLYMQAPSLLTSAMKSPANIALPMSPFGMPLPSPFTMSQHPASPPPIDTSLSSPAATTSSGPRRQSAGFASPVSATSPMTPSGSGWRGGHSRKGSAADSVTYVREHDEAGEGRWVLERRRTAESGELELIGREIVEGGRI